MKKENNRDEVTKLLAEALKQAEGQYNIDEMLSAIWSADMLLREDNGEMVEHLVTTLPYDSNIPEST